MNGLSGVAYPQKNRHFFPKNSSDWKKYDSQVEEMLALGEKDRDGMFREAVLDGFDVEILRLLIREKRLALALTDLF